MTAIETHVHTLSFADREPLTRALTNGLLFAYGDGTVPGINAIRFEFDGAELLAISTDRYRLCVEKVALKTPKAGEATSGREPFDFLLPVADAKAMLAAVKGASKIEPIDVDYDDDAAKTVSLRTLASTSTWHVNDYSSFPIWRALLPDGKERVASEEMAFTAAYLADLAKVQTGLGRSSRKAFIRVGLYGYGKPTRIDFEQGPTLLLMSVREPKDSTTEFGGV